MHKQSLSTMPFIVLLVVVCFILVLGSRLLAADADCGENHHKLHGATQ